MKNAIKKLMAMSLLGLFFISGLAYSQNNSNSIFDMEVVVNIAEIKEHNMKMNNIIMNDSIKTIMMENMKDHMKMDNKAMMDSCKMMMKDPEHKKMMKNMKGKMKMHDNSKMKSSMKTNMKNKTSIVRKGVIDLVAIDKNKDGKVFQDVMDWNVISDKPGTCPLCGMKLKKYSIEQASKNLIENGFKVN